MTMSAVRERLYDYIRIADDKKLRAIYTMLEDDIVEKTEWWKDNAFSKELETRYRSWESGAEKGFTLEEMDASIEALKQKRARK